MAGSELQSSSLIQALAAAKVLPDPAEIAAKVDRIKHGQPGADPAEMSRRVVAATTRKLAGIGAAASLPSVIPGAGTATQFALTGSTITAETWAILRELTTMQLTVAGLFGHSVHDMERRDELLIVWGIETGAIVPAAEAGKRIGQKIAVAQVNRHVSGAVLKKLNQKLGTTVLTKFGVKRGGVALGRLIPLGVGVAIGGGMNYATGRSFGAALIRYYAELLPSDGEVVIIG